LRIEGHVKVNREQKIDNCRQDADDFDWAHLILPEEQNEKCSDNRKEDDH
jgi:hypothetical protein